MRAILEGRVSPDRRGEQVRVAVLFADIRGFTTLSAARAPREVFELLNAYLERVTKAIHEHRGTIDKFIGDGILAVFGYPEPSETPAREAVAAGRAMLLAVEEFNAAHPTTALKIGIGIHCGEVLAGALGSSARYEFTIIGDAVNVASRLEELTKDFSQLMVVSRHAWERAGEPEGFAALGIHPVRGRGEIEIMGFGGKA
jgi:adenylate cyclase